MSEQVQTASPAIVPLPKARPSTETSGEDETLDTPEGLPRWQTLTETLKQCNQVMWPAHRTTDSAAPAAEMSHRRLSKLATICGTVAVLVAIVQMAFARLVEGHLLLGLEILAVLAAAGAVVLGAVSLRLAERLVERNTAERLRLAKVGFLIDSAAWSGDAGAAGRRFQRLDGEGQRITDAWSKICRLWNSGETWNASTVSSATS